jgi:preprotein translocase subunit SecG
MSILLPLLYVVFVLAAIVLIVVILLQEGRGGGFGDALGGQGQQTFGVGAKGINTFTAWVAGAFLTCAALITYLHREESGSLLEGIGPAGGATIETPVAPPAEPTEGGN